MIDVEVGSVVGVWILGIVMSSGHRLLRRGELMVADIGRVVFLWTVRVVVTTWLEMGASRSFGSGQGSGQRQITIDCLLLNVSWVLLMSGASSPCGLSESSCYWVLLDAQTEVLDRCFTWWECHRLVDMVEVDASSGHRIPCSVVGSLWLIPGASS